MATPFETFVNTELPLRTSIAGLPTADRYARFTGVGRAVEERTAAQVAVDIDAIIADGTRPFTGVVAGIGPTASNHLVTKEYVDSAISFIHTFQFNDTASDIVGNYSVMEEEATGEGESSFTFAGLGTGDDQPLENFATLVGVPGVAVFSNGTYEAHIHAEVTAGNKPVRIHFELYTSNAAGGGQVLRATSEESALVTSKGEVTLHANLASDVTINDTDRIIIKWLANVGATGSNVTVVLYAEGTTNAHLDIPTTTEILSSIFVRQDGDVPLSANWDAGSFKITAEQFESDIATGTAPLVVASTTLVPNLNADLVDGVEGTTLVVGPASVADEALMVADGTTGKLLKASNFTVGQSGELTTFTGTLALQRLKFEFTNSSVNTNIDFNAINDAVPSKVVFRNSDPTGHGVWLAVQGPIYSQDPADATKEMKLVANNITTGTVRSLTMKDADLDLATCLVADGSVPLTGSFDLGAAARLFIEGGDTVFAAFSPLSSAVNYPVLANAQTTKSPSLSVAGSDANIGLALVTKGTGLLAFVDDADSLFHDMSALTADRTVTWPDRAINFTSGGTFAENSHTHAATVDSVFTRTGDVVAAASDYDASQVDNDSGVSGAMVSNALDVLAAAIVAHTHLEIDITDLDHYTDADAITAVEGEATLDLTGAVTIAGVTTITGLATGGITDYDLLVGDTTTPDYGMVRIGDAVIGRTSFNVGNIDLDGTLIVQNLSGPVTGEIEFIWTESTGDTCRFALPKSAVGNATYNSRSMLLAGPAPADTDFVKVSYWQGQGIFDNLACDTAGDGADLGVQNDLEVEGDVFTDSIVESTTDAGVTVEGVLLKDGGVIGGTGSGDSLNLISTEHATKGGIIFGANSVYDQNLDALGINTLTPGDLRANTRLDIKHEGSPGYMGIAVASSGAVGHRGTLDFARARGTFASLATIADADLVNTIGNRGYDGTSWLGRAAWRVLVNGSVSTGVIPMDMEYRTGGSGLSTRFTIFATGHMRVAGSGRMEFDNINNYVYGTANTINMIGGTTASIDGGTSATMKANGTNVIVANTTGIGLHGQTPIAQRNYTVNNPSDRRTIDVSTITLADLAEVVGTMIEDHQDRGDWN